MFKNNTVNKRLKETKAPLHSAFKIYNLDDKKEVISLFFYRTKSKNTGYTKFICKMSIRHNDINIYCESFSKGSGFDVKNDSFLNALFSCSIEKRHYSILDNINEILNYLKINNTLICEI